MLPAGKSKKEIVLDLAGQGLTAPEIAKQTGIKYNTVYFYMNPEKCKKKSGKQEKENHEPGWNADRHACKTCQYRAAQADKINVGIGCAYALIVEHSRGCDVEDCNVYVRGKRISGKKRR